MNLTPEQLRQTADAIEAFNAGDAVEFQAADGKWNLTQMPPSVWPFIFDKGYRPAPKPEPPKPWDCAEDVPGPVCWIRSTTGEFSFLINGFMTGKVEINGRCYPQGGIPYSELANLWQYSTDRKTWLPCVKTQ